MPSVAAGFRFIDLVAMIPGRIDEWASFAGNRAEQDADKWLARHVLVPRGVWEWPIRIDVVLDDGRRFSCTHRVRYGRTNGTLRQAAVRALTLRSLNRRFDAGQRAEARQLAEAISGWTDDQSPAPGRPFLSPILNLS